MVDIQKLYVHPGCPHCWKILNVSEFVGRSNDIEFLTWEQTKSPEYLAKNPNGKVPAILTSKGVVYESHAIMRALARAHPEAKLYGKNSFEQGKVDQWLDWLSGELGPTFYSTHGAISGSKPGDEKSFAEGLENLKKKLQVLEEHLSHHQFLVGDTVTIADLSLAATARGPAATVFDTEFRKQFPNFFNYFHAVSNLPQVVKVKSFLTCFAPGVNFFYWIRP
jgi:glutathione S-transferase